MSDSYKGYPLFNDIQSVNLRSWNRAAVMHNMMEDGHEGVLAEYIDRLDKASKMQCYVVLKIIVTEGVEAAKKSILRKETIQ